MKKTLLSLLILTAVSISQAQNVIIPDANFKAYLVGNTLINTNADAEISLAEAASFTGAITCNAMNIADLTGIEAFTNPITLDAKDNAITTLDLSANTSLNGTVWLNNNPLTTLIMPGNPVVTSLYANNCSLTSVDVSGLSNLNVLMLINNNLPSLNVSNNTLLGTLNVGNNPFTSIDLTGLTNLNSMACQSTGLLSLDITPCTSLTALYAPDMADITELNMANGNNMSMAPGSIDCLNAPNLTCVTVDNISLSNQVWPPYFDAGVTFSLDCSQGGTPLASSISIVAAGGVAEVEVGSTLQMTASVLPANASQMVIWQTQDVTGQASIDQNSGLLTGLTIGTVDVGAVAIDGSNTFALITVNVIEAVGIEDLNQSEMTIYPNPAIDKLTIQSQTQIENVSIFNLSGMLVQSEINASFSINQLDAGVYFVNVITQNGMTQMKLVKK